MLGYIGYQVQAAFEMFINTSRYNHVKFLYAGERERARRSLSPVSVGNFDSSQVR
jgi:hypothetical protein